MSRRTERLNSLLREVISEVIRDHVKNPHIGGIITITRAEITPDLRYAKVYVSILAKTEEQRKETLNALKSAASFIAVTCSKKVVMHYFPELRFILDDSAEKHMRIQKILNDISSKESKTENHEDDGDESEEEEDDDDDLEEEEDDDDNDDDDDDLDEEEEDNV